MQHVVLYKAYPGNPKAAQHIICNAKRLLGTIPRSTGFHVGHIIDLGRTVGDTSYDVMLNMTFGDARDYAWYMQHPQHLAFVRFVLRGWMLTGSTAADPAAEFIDYILKGGKPHERERNPRIPDSEVVWDDERVIDAE